MTNNLKIKYGIEEDIKNILDKYNVFVKGIKIEELNGYTDQFYAYVADKEVRLCTDVRITIDVFIPVDNTNYHVSKKSHNEKRNK